MPLSYVQLVALVEAGVITNVHPDQINGSSIDITLGRTIMIEAADVVPQVVSLRDKGRIEMWSHDMGAEFANGYYDISPGEFILAQSEQVFHLPLDISAEYKLKSSLARNGLEHMNAGWCDPGWNGSVLTLEFVNLTRFHKIRIRPGDRIGQVVFFMHDEPVPYDRSYAARGRYNSKPEVVGALPDPTEGK